MVFGLWQRMSVGAKTIFAGDGIFEDDTMEGLQCKSHVAAEEDKGTDAGEVLNSWPDWVKVDNDVEDELAEENCDEKSADVDEENGLLGDAFVGVENEGDEEHGNEEADEFSGEIVGVETVDSAVVKAPEKNWGEGELDVLPSRFVDGGEEAEDVVMVRPLVQEVGESADCADDDDAEPKIECIVHIFIIPLVVFHGGELWYNWRRKRGRVVEGARLEIVWAG